jgi:hypothetical protein
VEEAEADETLKLNGLFDRRSDPAASRSVRKNVPVLLVAVTTKVKVDPPLTVLKETNPLPLGPYVGTTKSVDKPVLNVDTSLSTVMVQEMTSPIRITVVEAVV